MDVEKYVTFMKAAAQLQKLKAVSKKSILARTTLDTKKLNLKGQEKGENK